MLNALNICFHIYRIQKSNHIPKVSENCYFLTLGDYLALKVRSGANLTYRLYKKGLTIQLGYPFQLP
jgi:hypothetical protein